MIEADTVCVSMSERLSRHAAGRPIDASSQQKSKHNGVTLKQRIEKNNMTMNRRLLTLIFIHYSLFSIHHSAAAAPQEQRGDQRELKP